MLKGEISIDLTLLVMALLTTQPSKLKEILVTRRKEKSSGIGFFEALIPKTLPNGKNASADTESIKQIQDLNSDEDINKATDETDVNWNRPKFI